MKKVVALLCVASAGMVLVLAGLGVDAWLHARDATLAEREGIFTLSNPGHALLGAGIALVGGALFAALYVAWGMSNAPGILGQRWLRLVSMQAAGLASAAAVLVGMSVSAASHTHDDEPVVAASHTHGDAPTGADAIVFTSGDAGGMMLAEAHAGEHAMPAADMPAAVPEAHTHIEPAQAAPLVSAQPVSQTHAHEAAGTAPPPPAAAAPPAEDHAHDMMPGPAPTQEAAHDHGTTPPAPVDAACAENYVEEVRAATARFQDFDVAVAEGYYKSTPGQAVAHYANRTYITDGVQVDPSKPEVLMYVQTASGMHLAGIMYLAPFGGSGTEICGGEAHWHTHDEVCITAAGMLVGFAVNGACPGGARAMMLPPMLHVWLVPNPGGPFDEKMDPVALLQYFS